LTEPGRSLRALSTCLLVTDPVVLRRGAYCGSEQSSIALARAFVRDAEILIFDEPTSALDPEAEWNVFRHIRKLAHGRAVILISHRISTVRTADRIHIFDQGCIVASGSHDELMAFDGRYARMYEVQERSRTVEKEAIGGRSGRV
jgi:ABC-type multidrug transport system fused ATPase/permease subunit